MKVYTHEDVLKLMNRIHVYEINRDLCMLKLTPIDMEEKLLEYWNGGIKSTEEGGKSFDQYHNEHHEDKLVEIPTSSQTETAMIIPEAISILKIHQQWRLGADIVMIEPKELTKAIDVLINYHIDIMNETLSSKTEISDEEIEKAAETFWPQANESSLIRCWILGAKWYRKQLKQRQ